MDREKIIEKIKLLLKLAESPNENEAANAKVLADSLLTKHGIDPEEVKDNTFKYPEENILFRSHARSFWKNRLAMVLSNQFFCRIIEEKITATAEGSTLEEFVYYVYGDAPDVEAVKRLYTPLELKIGEVITTASKGRGALFCDSFSEGLMNAVKYRIENGDFDFKIQELKQEKIEKSEAIVKTTTEKFPEKNPTENKRDIIEDKKPIDIIGYMKGEQAGMNLELSDLLSGKEINIDKLLDDPYDNDEDDDLFSWE